MNELIIIAVVWAVFRMISSFAKKKPGQSGNKQREAVEEQRRLREAYETAQKLQDAAPPETSLWQQEKAPWQREPVEQPPALAAEPHHIDAAGDEYCAAATRTRAKQHKKELRQQQKPAAPRPASPGNVLVNGIIMAEILGPPRSKRIKKL